MAAKSRSSIRRRSAPRISAPRHAPLGTTVRRVAVTSPAAAFPTVWLMPGSRRSEVDAFQLRLGIARAGNGTRRYGGGDPRDFILAQLDSKGAEILDQALDPLGAGDRDDIRPLGEQPGEDELGGGATLVARDRRELPDQREILVEIGLGETRVAPAAITLRDVGGILHLAGQQAAAERRIGDVGDAELAGRAQGFLRLGAVEQRVFALNGGDRMDAVGATDRLGPRLAEAEGANLALLDQLGHGADRLLDRHGRINAVLVIEVDDFDAQPFQARIARLRDVSGAAVDAVEAALAPDLAEFGRQHDACPSPGNRPADELLVVAPTVHVGAVEQSDAAVERLVDDRDRVAIVARAVDAGERHAAEADRGNLEIARPKGPLGEDVLCFHHLSLRQRVAGKQ